MRAVAKKWRFLVRTQLIVVLLLSVSMLGMTTSVESSAGWYDSDWGERRAVVIDNTGNSNTLTDYQVQLSVAYDTDMQPDFGDLRFTDSDGASELPYWIEDHITSTSATVWAKVPSIVGSSTKTIYIYYGNPSANNASNGEDTFIFFDDFSGATLDPDKWDNLSDGSGTVTIVDGRLRCDSPSGAYNHARVKTKMSFGDVCVQHKWSLITWPVCPTVVDNNRAYIYFGTGGNYIIVSRLRNHYCSPSLNHRDLIGTALYVDESSQGYYEVHFDEPYDTLNYPEGTYKFIRYGTNAMVYYDNTLLGSWTTGFEDASPLLFDVYGSFRFPPTTVDFDDVFVRKYTSPEPTASVSGEVECAFQTFVIEHMTVKWARDVGHGKDAGKDWVSISGRLQLPDGYTVASLGKSATITVTIANSSVGDIVAFKERSLRQLGVMWGYRGQGQPPGEDMNVTYMTLWWIVKGSDGADWAKFYLRGVLEMPEGLGFDTEPAQATVTLELPVTAEDDCGSLLGKETVEFEVLERMHLWSYHLSLNLPNFQYNP